MCHTTFHSLLRSSSMPEPRRPPRRCLWTRLGAGTPRCLSARVFCVTAEERHSAPSSLVRPHPLVMSSPQPESPAESAAFRVRSPKGLLRCRTARLLRPLCFSTCASSLFLVEPPASLLRSGQGQTTTLSLLCARRPPEEGQLTKYNDPSAGSPTETLLRLLLPLDAGARRTSGHAEARPPDNSPQHPIGRSDGRCVQRAGTHSARDH